MTKRSYSWLEHLDDPKVVQLYQDHNQKTDAYARQTSIEAFTDTLEAYGEADSRGLPRRYGKKTFWMERQKDWQKYKLLYKEANGPDKVLLDFEGTDKALDYWFVSPKATRLVYGVSEKGNERSTLYIYDLLKNTQLAESIPFGGFTDLGSVCWLNDRQFIYPRMNGFDQTGPEDKWLTGTKLYQHTVGDDPHDDLLVYGAGLPDAVMLTPTLSTDKSTLYVTVSADEMTHDLWVVELATLLSQQIAMPCKAAVQVTSAFGQVFVHTNLDAPNYRLLTCDEQDLEYDLMLWDEVLPESDDVLGDIVFNANRNLYALYSHNVSSLIRVYDLYGNQTGVVRLPKHTVVHVMRGRVENPEVSIMYSGFVTPTTIAQHSGVAEDAAVNVLWSRDPLEGDEQMVVEQQWAVSADGEKIPYFIVKASDTALPAPTIMYGYGGFNISLTPSYLGLFRAWILKGGVYVHMSLRGGSEFGEQWHKMGSMEHKQNTFNDCHAIAEDLVARGITTHDQLGVMGGSNGGLLVATVCVQRPELYRAGAALVPLTDMFEFYKHQVAEFWVHEYGDPRIAEQRRWIEKWNPLYLVEDRSEKLEVRMGLDQFPALYVECALHDARVHPFHSFKYVSAVTDTYGDHTKGPVLLRTWTDTGHQGSNLTKRQAAAKSAEYLAFFARELGL